MADPRDLLSQLGRNLKDCWRDLSHITQRMTAGKVSNADLKLELDNLARDIDWADDLVGDIESALLVEELNDRSFAAVESEEPDEPRPSPCPHCNKCPVCGWDKHPCVCP